MGTFLTGLHNIICIIVEETHFVHIGKMWNFLFLYFLYFLFIYFFSVLKIYVSKAIRSFSNEKHLLATDMSANRCEIIKSTFSNNN